MIPPVTATIATAAMIPPVTATIATAAMIPPVTATIATAAMIPPVTATIATAAMIAATAVGSAAVLHMLVTLMALLLPILPLRWQPILLRYLLMYLPLLLVPPLHSPNRILLHPSLTQDHNLHIGPNPLLLDSLTLAGPYLLLVRPLLD
ncbi:unnamed protein product [Aphanomyces euteiches]